MDLKELMIKFAYHLLHLVLIIAVILLLIMTLGCATGEPMVKLYYYDSTHGLFVRDLKDRDVLAPEQAHGFICLSKRDFERVAEGILVLKSSCVEKNYPFGNDKEK